jgi:hypothetical protein
MQRYEWREYDEEDKGMMPEDDGIYYLCEDVEPFIEFFQVSIRMSELLKILTFEDNVSKEHQEYVECSNRYLELKKELSAVQD